MTHSKGDYAPRVKSEGRGEQHTINILGLVAVDLTNLQFAVGGEGSAVTAGKVVDDYTEDLVTRNALESRLKAVDVLNVVTTLLSTR